MASGSSSSGDSNRDSKWYFTVEQLQNSPSRSQGIDADKEIDLRQQAAYLIQEMGQLLRVNQLCINTAIVYMHRFYAFHSFTQFHQNGIAMASLFLAAKVEEQPRKLETVINVSNSCRHVPEAQKEPYAEQAQDLVFNENVLLQTLGFDVAVDHPHTHVVKTCHLVKGNFSMPMREEACKDLAQTSYFLASNSLHLTTMCLQYRPTVVACFCIHLACKWSRWEIPQSKEEKDWFYYVDKTVTLDLLEQLTDEFIAIYERSPARLKHKLSSSIKLSDLARSGDSQSSGSQHRSSSTHRSHSQLKQTMHALGDYKSSSHPKMMLHGAQALAVNAASASASRQHRNERSERVIPPDRPFSSNPPHRPSSSTSNGPVPMRSGSGASGSSSSSSNVMPAARPSQSHSSHDLPNFGQRSTGLSKVRSSSSMQQSHQQQQQPQQQTRHSSSGTSSSSASSKPDQKHLSKEHKPHADINNKNLGMNRNVPTASSSRHMGPGNYPQPNSNQAMINRSSSSSSTNNNNNSNINSSSSSSSSNLNNNNSATTQQEQQTISVHNSQQQKSQPSLIDMSSYDIRNIRSLDTMENLLSTSPKNPSGKAPSIFSPEWNEKPNSMPVSHERKLMCNDNGSNGSESTLLDTLSPKKQYDKRAMSSNDTMKKEKYQQQQQQQQQSQRMSMQSDKRPQSSSLKRDNSTFSGMQYDANLPQNILDSKSMKRSYNTDSMQLDNMDMDREFKIRKMDQMSPSTNLGDQIKSGDAFDDAKSMKPYGTSSNGIETNTDFVSSLLKQSLSDSSSKYSSSSQPTAGGSNPIAGNQVQSIPGNQNDPLTAVNEFKTIAGYNLQSMEQRDQSINVNQQQMQSSIKSDEFNQANMDHSQLSNRFVGSHQQFKTDRSDQQAVHNQQQPQQQQQQMVHQSQPSNASDNIGLRYMQHKQQQMQDLNKDWTEQMQQPQQQQLDPIQKQLDPQLQLQLSHQNQSQSQPQLQSQPPVPPQLVVKLESPEHRSKSEKKKKKEKHKNKDKEKSKDKEERKKHKKDKDRHKDKFKDKDKSQHGNRSSDEPSVHNPIRITIPKEKLNLSQTDASIKSGYDNLQMPQPPHQVPAAIKMKITKDRIKPDIQDAAIGHNANELHSTSTASASASTSLKIKIPKDVIENYNNGGGSTFNPSQQTHTNESIQSQNHSGGNSRKKDRNRDRDKAMRSSNVSNPNKMMSQYNNDTMTHHSQHQHIPPPPMQHKPQQIHNQQMQQMQQIQNPQMYPPQYPNQPYQHQQVPQAYQHHQQTQQQYFHQQQRQLQQQQIQHQQGWH